MSNNGNEGELQSSLTLDLSQFRRALKSALTQVSSFGKEFKQAFSTSGNTGKVAKEMQNVQRSVEGAKKEVQKMGIGLRDLERIVGGILLSQAFYGAKAAIEEAAAALVTFMNEMEKAQIALEYFLQTPEQASSFLKDMQSFAADTSFNTTQALALSRKLMAAQFNPNDVKPVMTILNDAAAASGGTAEQMDRIVLAMTQIKTNGKLAGQEMRQLAEAGIPIYKILQEELRLTGEEIMNVGDLKIPGDTAVQAILDGLEKRYKGAADRIADTIPGMIQTIQDDSKIIGSSLFKAPYAAIQELMLGWRDAISEMRNHIFEGGLGRALEEMFPEELWGSIRRIAASVKSLGASFITLMGAITPVAQVVAGALASGLGILLPILATLANAIANVAHFATNSVPGIKYLVAALGTVIVANVAAKAMMFFWGVLRLGTIAKAAAAMVTMLSKSIARLTVVILRNPVVLGITLVTAALLHFTVGLQQAITWLDTFINRIAGLAGIDADLALPNVPTADAEIDDYIAKWGGVGQGATDAVEEVEEAAKEYKKFIAAFDEVFQVPEDEEKDEPFSIEAPSIPGLDGLGDLDLDLPEKIELPELVWPEIQDPELPPLLARWLGGGFQWPKWPPFPPLPALSWDLSWETTMEAIKNKVQGFKDWLEGLNWNPIPAPTFAIEWGTMGERIRGWINGWFPELQPLTVPAPILAPGWELLTSVWPKATLAWENYKKDFVVGWTYLGDLIATGWSTSITTAGLMFDDMANNFNTALKQLQNGFAATGEVISTMWKDALSSTVTFGAAFLGALAASMLAGWEAVKGMAANVTGVFQGLGPVLAGTLSSGLDILSKIWEDWGWLIKEIAFIAISLLLGVFTAGLGTIATHLVRWVPKAAGFFRAFGPTILGFIKGLPDDFIRVVSGIVTKIPSLVTSIANGFRGLGNAIVKVIKDIPEKIMGIFKNIKIPSFSDIGGKLSATWDKISVPGYATGGIIQKEHLAMVGEGGKKEAVIPLENSSAMAPFAEAVANLLAQSGNLGGTPQDDRPILYVGNLIADDRGLRELERRMAVVRMNESARGVR